MAEPPDNVVCPMDDRRTATSLIVKFVALNFTYIFALCQMLALKRDHKNYPRIVWCIICPFASLLHSTWLLVVLSFHCCCEAVALPWKDAKKSIDIFLSMALGYKHPDKPGALPADQQVTVRPSRWNLVPVLVITAQLCMSFKLFITRSQRDANVFYDHWTMGMVLVCLGICLQTAVILLTAPAPIAEDHMSMILHPFDGKDKELPPDKARIQDRVNEIWAMRSAVNRNILVYYLRWDQDGAESQSLRRWLGGLYHEMSGSDYLALPIIAFCMRQGYFTSSEMMTFIYLFAISALIQAAVILGIPLWWAFILSVGGIYRGFIEILLLIKGFDDDNRVKVTLDAFSKRVVSASEGLAPRFAKIMNWYPVVCFQVLMAISLGVCYKRIIVNLSDFANWPVTVTCPGLWKDPLADSLWSLA